MMEQELFSERQHFRQLWLWVPLLAIDAIVLYGVLQQVVLGLPFGERPAGNAGLLAVFAGMMVATALVYYIRLDTRIGQDGIHYRFRPFHLHWRRVAREDILRAHVREYRPLLEYGGWGIRYGFRGGMAYNISGSVGIQLELKGGVRLLIGTQDAGGAAAALKQLGLGV